MGISNIALALGRTGHLHDGVWEQRDKKHDSCVWIGSWPWAWGDKDLERSGWKMAELVRAWVPTPGLVVEREDIRICNHVHNWLAKPDV